MRVAIAIAATCVLAGCTKPIPTALSESGVSIKYDPALYSLDLEVAQAARDACNQYGRTPKFRTEQQDSPLGFVYAHFDCVR